MSNLLIGIIGSIIAAIIIAVIVRLYKRYQLGRGHFAGEWNQIIPKYQDEPEKRDIVNCRQKGERIFGEVQRIEPYEQNWKKWKFNGRVRENVLVAYFWSDDPCVNSFGSYILVHSGEYKYMGHYTKLLPTCRDIDKIIDMNPRIPFRWEKRINNRAN